MRRGFGWDDSAELAAGIERLGIVHQTGYPIYLLLGKAVGFVLPTGSAAIRANAWSALTAAAAIGLLWHYVCRLTGSALAGSVAAALFGTSGVFWIQATEASVYPMFAIALLLLLLTAERWVERGGALRLMALAGATGLLVMSHRTGLVFAAAVALFIVVRRRRALIARELGAALALLVPLAFSLYVPIRADFESFPNARGGESGRALDLLLGRMPAGEAQIGAAGVAGVLRHAAQAALLVVSQLSLAVLLLAPFGLWALRRNAAFLACGLAPAVVVSALVVTTPASYAYWHMPFILVAAVACGAGVISLRSYFSDASAPTKSALGSLAVLALLTGPALGVSNIANRGDSASDWTSAALSAVPPQTTVGAPWTAYAPLRAMQELDGVRTDVRVSFGRYFSATSLRAPKTDFVVTLSERPLRSPPGTVLRRVGPAARVNVKGVTELRLGPLPLVDRQYSAPYVVRLYATRRR